LGSAARCKNPLYFGLLAEFMEPLGFLGDSEFMDAVGN
jgi:hypothetical protein